MILPNVFKADIQTKIIDVFPTVEIDGTIFLSTKNHTKLEDSTSNYYKPILLNIPSVKESVDFESRKFKISNVTLNISNYKINGERFTDILKDKSYLGAETIVRWETVGAKTDSDRLVIFRGTIKRITHDDKKVTVQLEDLTQSKFHKELPTNRTSRSLSLSTKRRDKPIPMVYGHLKEAPTVLDVANTIKADSEPLTLVKSDNPDVSGYYETHPLWGEFVEQQIVSDPEGVPPVKMIIDDHHVYVPSKAFRTITSTKEGNPQWTSDTETEGWVKLTPTTAAEDVGEEEQFFGKVIQVISASKSNQIRCHYREGWNNWEAHDDDGGEWASEQRFKDKVTESLSDGNYTFHSMDDLNGYNPNSQWTAYDNQDNIGYGYKHQHYRHGDTSNDNWPRNGAVNQTLIRVSIESDPQFEFLDVYSYSQLAINEFKFPPMSHKGASDAHSVLITSRTRVGPWSGTTEHNGLRKMTRYANTRVCSLSTEIRDEFDAEETIIQDWKFKFLFSFPDLIGETYSDGSEYAGLDSTHPNWDRLIQITGLSATGKFDSGFSMTDNDPTVETWYVQVTNSTHALGEYNLSFGAYISDIGANASGETHYVQWEMGIGGNWSEVDLLQLVEIEKPTQKNFYLNVLGRQDDDGLITNPIAVMRDIAINELGLSENDIDTDSYNHAFNQHIGYEFAFSVHKSIDSKKLLEDMAKSTICYPYFKNNGKLAFPSLQRKYSYAMYANDAVSVSEKDVISFSFNKTKPEKVYTKIRFSYNYDYIAETYQDRWVDSLYPSQEELEYNSYETVEDNVLQFECPYIRDKTKAQYTWFRMWRYHKNAHLIIKAKLPLNYIELEVGSLLKFENLINGIRAYGVDYTKVTNPANQWFYPLFFVTSVNKNLDWVEIEAEQIHQLNASVTIQGLEDSQNWADAGLIEGVQGEEEFSFDDEVDETWEDYLDEEDQQYVYESTPPELGDPVYWLPLGYMNNYKKHWFKFVNGVIPGGQLINWFFPEALGIPLFDSLIPSVGNVQGWQGGAVEDYTVLEIFIRDEDGVPRYYQLRNISESPWLDDMELGWQTGNITGESFSGGTEGTMNSIDGLQFTNEYYGYLRYGQGFINAYNSGVLSDFNPGTGGLTFVTEELLYGPLAHIGLGDTNEDGNVNVLDIVNMTNYILGNQPSTGAGATYNVAAMDFRPDGTINILDIMAIVNWLLGLGEELDESEYEEGGG